ncbi:hypothetical protein Bpfe_020279 [Biomphalaria pfeifferi]|uniref:Uncharacterized protein n=1 Tax=Biomphalaria pfeifferi TaxID=112525 RepID=A0AAD8B955_BIOPF|nr:hypothetical protein Bpfe_020279 [Biomphalaria pfeifferi]
MIMSDLRSVEFLKLEGYVWPYVKTADFLYWTSSSFAPLNISTKLHSDFKIHTMALLDLLFTQLEKEEGLADG